jgi:S-adenosylmethionine/arginine decarboxylase-like enzyme
LKLGEYLKQTGITCGKRINPQKAASIIAQKLEANRICKMNMERGLGELNIVKDFEGAVSS